MDLYLRGQADHLHEEWLAKSLPVQLSSALVGHAVYRDKYKVFDLLHNFNIGFALISAYLFSFVGILVIALLINRINHRIQFGRQEGTDKIRKKIISVWVAFQENNQHSAVGLFVLFIHLFLWLTQIFLINNIKTNKVVSSN